ncbi:hypothetical protein [Blastopirellula retiformator]|uniref:Uncharacterized protein n=1 Tax=Blastopirellula retiformator TaxID=2527970 RepID=A0A5C5VKD0_9BACT|nr:hypothetical protein [Blastopirellula retiformator]TWT38410.1 hypothetical protein Enr8_01020 [Blastopirellula retiformator]
MTRKTKTYLLILGAAFLLLVGLPLWFIFGPPRRLVISKETTVLTQPLNAEGQVDYVEAVLQTQRAGVTPQNNAAVPLVQAMWQEKGLNPEQKDFLCKELGITKPEQEGIDDDLWNQRYKDLIIA